MGLTWQGHIGLGRSQSQGCQPTSVLVPRWAATSPPLLWPPPGLTGSLNRGHAQTHGTGRSPVPPQHPGTRDQTYLDELISIPKGSGVGAARLAPPSEGGQRRGGRPVLQGA